LAVLIKNWGVAKPITCIPNGIASVKKQFNTQEFDLISVCRLVKWKNLDKLIIANARNKTSLVIVGSGPEEENLKKLASEMNSNVIFTGLLNEELVLKYLFKSKVFVLISSYEGLSFSLLQAMACELPSIVSAIQGNIDVVTHEQEGMVIDISQDDALISAIILLLNNPIKRDTLGKNALNKVNSKFSQTAQIRKVISQLVDGVLL
jgi:glycosyltransferase involved in cell wall biosynthesis